MKEKRMRLAERAAMGRGVPIIARNPTSVNPVADGPGALATLDDENNLRYTRLMYEFLQSGRLHHCRGCDEVRPVFDRDWPQSGVDMGIPLAGKSEVVAKAGYFQSRKHPGYCTRCEGKGSAYGKMFSAANLQHLGPRHDGLSNLTWYESLLIARVHPVVSVITMMATGLLTYGGHICNYYVKVLEWWSELPSLLRDKRWFLVKRRKSIRATDAQRRQKKPTTANRRRLEAAISDCLKYMPTVYQGSVVKPENLLQFPEEGEVEMEERGEHVSLDGGFRITREFGVAWLQRGATGAEAMLKYPCAVAFTQVARDAQETDLRGAVSADTAWDLIRRYLLETEQEPNRPDTEEQRMATDNLAAMLVAWQGRIPDVLYKAIFVGCAEHYDGKMSSDEEEHDRQLIRWVRQRIHEELEATKEATYEERGDDGMLEFEMDCQMTTAGEVSITEQTEREAAKLIGQLRSQAEETVDAAADADWDVAEVEEGQGQGEWAEEEDWGEDGQGNEWPDDGWAEDGWGDGLWGEGWGEGGDEVEAGEWERAELGGQPQLAGGPEHGAAATHEPQATETPKSETLPERTEGEKRYEERRAAVEAKALEDLSVDEMRWKLLEYPRDASCVN